MLNAVCDHWDATVVDKQRQQFQYLGNVKIRKNTKKHPSEVFPIRDWVGQSFGQLLSFCRCLQQVFGPGRLLDG